MPQSWGAAKTGGGGEALGGRHLHRMAIHYGCIGIDPPVLARKKGQHRIRIILDTFKLTSLKASDWSRYFDSPS